jgi:hypothetical protein
MFVVWLPMLSLLVLSLVRVVVGVVSVGGGGVVVVVAVGCLSCPALLASELLVGIGRSGFPLHRPPYMFALVA